MSLGDLITTNIGIVNDNTKCVNDALHAVHEDTSDIRRVVNYMSATHLTPPNDPAPPASMSSQPEPSRGTGTYPWSAGRLEALPVFVGPYAHLHEPVGSKPTPHPPYDQEQTRKL